MDACKDRRDRIAHRRLYVARAFPETNRRVESAGFRHMAICRKDQEMSKYNGSVWLQKGARSWSKAEEDMLDQCLSAGEPELEELSGYFNRSQKAIAKKAAELGWDLPKVRKLTTAQIRELGKYYAEFSIDTLRTIAEAEYKVRVSKPTLIAYLRDEGFNINGRGRRKGK